MRIFSSGWSEGFDGPGRRLVFYLKGCNFRCRWCANPEGLNGGVEILFYPARSKFAEKACPYGAVRGTTIDRSICAKCADRPCVRVAGDRAFEVAGQDVTAEEVAARAVKSRGLFEPDGGVTFGGGEPTLQADGVLAAIKLLQDEKVHTAIESNASTREFARFIGKVDLLIADVKCASPELHRQWVGVDNEAVPGNLLLAAKGQRDLLVRIMLVTGMNDGAEEMDRMAEALGRLAKEREELRAQVLRLHHLGEPKYAALGLNYAMKGVACPGEKKAAELEHRLASAGVSVRNHRSRI